VAERPGPLEQVVSRRTTPLWSRRYKPKNSAQPMKNRRQRIHQSPALFLAVGLLQDRHDLLPGGVLLLEPGVQGALVVFAVPAPAVDQLELVLEVQGQVVAGHDAAGEEVVAHPVLGAGVFVGVGMLAVAEHVHEEAPTRA
jgi:hypothetical protein